MKYLLLALILLLPAAAFAQEMQFVPLTGLPGLDTITNAANSSLPDFFNTLYKLCIGAAALIAVLNIMYAGSQSILQEGSITERGKVRSRITNSVLGLLLVLSPAIVFGIINPEILDLNIGNLDQLRLQNIEQTSENNFGMPSIEDSVAAAGACGVTLTEAQTACLQQPAASDRHMQDCLMAGGQAAGGLTYEQVQCVIDQARGESPEERPQFPGSVNPGTYVGFASLRSDDYVNPPIGADQFAQQWLSETCRAPKQGSVGACNGYFDGTPRYCMDMRALCKVTSMVVNTYRVKASGDWLWGEWQALSSADNSAIAAFRRECAAAVRNLSGEGIDAQRESPRECTQQQITSAGRTYTSGTEYECARETYTCDVRP